MERNQTRKEISYIPHTYELLSCDFHKFYFFFFLSSLVSVNEVLIS